jgi:divalent metal cation (Fe/Co/Zn/Cd) transporter
MQRVASGGGTALRYGQRADPARQHHHGRQGMEFISTLGASLILVVASAWWIFRK